MADEQITSNTANIPYLNLIDVGSDQAAPAAGRAILYVKSGALYVRRSTGDPASVGGSVTLASGRLAVGDGDGLLSALALGTEGQLVTADASGHATWADPASATGGPFGGHVTLLPMAYESYSGHPLAFMPSGTGWLQGWWTQAAPAQDDSWTFKVSMSAGTYTFMFLGLQAADAPILHVYDGATQLGTVDTYATSYAYSVPLKATGLVVASSGLKDLKIAAESKNASSSGYKVYAQMFALWRTA